MSSASRRRERCWFLHERCGWTYKKIGLLHGVCANQARVLANAHAIKNRLECLPEYIDFMDYEQYQAASCQTPEDLFGLPGRDEEAARLRHYKTIANELAAEEKRKRKREEDYPWMKNYPWLK